ncbi:MAG: acyl-CoA thioester hydrolase/BAAT C-terminal domain-containing protein [Lagierella massiliensis]|nr:acyl-CoA thioester hydrolase/BAAT C-terminal domain-containing protein [Lagierella massiliensis]
MKLFFKIVLRIIIISAIITFMIFLIRIYNDKKYKKTMEMTTPEYYNDVTNLSLYPSSVEGVDLTYVNEGRVQGFRFSPKKRLFKGVVICYGGSEGSPSFEEAERLAKEGYETFALFMFGMENQQKTLTKIPLEQFEEVISYIKQNVTDNLPITVMGASKGAEYALNLASKYEEIDNVILKAPSSYNFSGLDFKDYGSSWTYEGKELPYIDLKKSSFATFAKTVIIPSIINSPISYKGTYDSAINKDILNYEKLIPVKDINANILIIAGGKDAMWNSSEMANIIKKQNENVEVHIFKEAGHIFVGNGIIESDGLKIRVGGSLEDNKRAEEESINIINDFLMKNHKN